MVPERSTRSDKLKSEQVTLARTNGHMSVGSDGKLLNNTLGRNACFLEVPQHLVCRCLLGPVASSKLDCMIFGLVWSDKLDISCDLTVIQLQELQISF